MTFRMHILAGLIAGLAAPAISFASSASLTRYDIEHGQTALLSERGFFATRASGRSASAAEPNRVDPSKEQVRHQQAMDAGYVRMTTGDMKGSAIASGHGEPVLVAKGIDPAREQARHQQAMNTGHVRMTTGAMEGSVKK